jgi:hypothetical protein
MYMLKKLNVDELYNRFVQEMESASSCEKSNLKKMTASIMVVREYLKLLKEFVVKDPLDKTEEIYFFKEVKPKFYQWLIYHVELNSIETAKPFPDGKNIFRYYGKQLSFLNRFLRQNEFHYQYYKLDATEMDNFYFVRGVEIPHQQIIEMPEVDQSFSTNMDYLFAKFMAYENLQGYILGEMRKLSQKPELPNFPNEDIAIRLKWTGDKTNLVEVIYGLFYTGQLNSGNATVADIIKWMEHHLQIDLSRSYKNFIDIKNRKRDSPTKFLDKMKDFILQRIDEDNRFKPNRGIKLIEDRGNK